MEIVHAHEGPSLTAARVLMREYLGWVLEATRDAGLDPETLRAHYYEGDAETLPGAFAPPDGCLLLARDDQGLIGLVGFQRVDDGSCEMKRLYVRPRARGKGAARSLALRLLDEARGAGYRTMRLETRTFMPQAITLYDALGFVACDAFHAIPHDFRAATHFMEIEL